MHYGESKLRWSMSLKLEDGLTNSMLCYSKNFCVPDFTQQFNAQLQITKGPN
jgi:hypothetical protein